LYSRNGTVLGIRLRCSRNWYHERNSTLLYFFFYL